MKKEEFSKILRKNLAVLDEKEINDLVQEYEQHIDMKVKEGLTEEAAIADFGNLKELTSGILEAYHVKSNYKDEKKSIDLDKVKEESMKATQKATSVIGKGAAVTGRGVKGLAGWCMTKVKGIVEQIKRPFVHYKQVLLENKQNRKMGIFARLWLFIVGMCDLVLRFAKWCVKTAWNVCCFGVGVMFGIGVLMDIFAFGLLIVLLANGYPVIGVLLIVAGLGLIGSACMLFAFTLIVSKKKKQSNGNHLDMDGTKSEVLIEDTKQEEKTIWKGMRRHA